MTPAPDFRAPDFLRQHILDTLAFYDSRCIDPSGGMYQGYRDDGSVYDAGTRHLGGSAGFVVIHAQAAARWPTHPRAGHWRDAARHGLQFLAQAHRRADGGYHWLLHWQQGQARVLDARERASGLAFVLQAQARALQAGLPEARPALQATRDHLDAQFWDPGAQLYACERQADGPLLPYRGQAANMHVCEALLTVAEATGQPAALERAATLAEGVTVRLAARTHGHLWPHFHEGWTPDWTYHRHDRSDPARPWGYPIGHWVRWVRLLLWLERLQGRADDAGWPLRRARDLFAAATRHGWDSRHGGLVRSVAPAGDAAEDGALVVHDGDKHHAVQAEALAAAAALACRTGEGGYWDWYDRLWDLAWRHFVDTAHGGWYALLGPDLARLTDEKSAPGKVDGANLGACHSVLDLLSP